MATDKPTTNEGRRDSAGVFPFGEAVDRRLGAVSDGLNQAIMTVCIFCILVMLGISFVGAFYMSVTGDALSWTYSLARLFIPWLALLSITVAYKMGEHIAMTSLLQVLPKQVLPALRATKLVVAALFAGLLVWYGWSYAASSRQLYMVSDQIQIDARWVAAAVPVTGLILVVHMLCGRLVADEGQTAGLSGSAAGLDGDQP